VLEPIDNNLKSNIHTKLVNQESVIGLIWLLFPEPAVNETFVELEDIIISAKFEKCIDKGQYLLEEFQINYENIVKLVTENLGQD